MIRLTENKMSDCFEKVLQEKKQVVWQEIQRYLQTLLYQDGFLGIPSGYQSQVEFHHQLVSDYPCRQGKYLRPALLLLTAEAMGVPLRKAMRTAAAMQISEDWILIHDDFEDDSSFRRGKPTLHQIYGPELAVNAGDALQILMWKVLADNREILGASKTLGLIDEFYQMLSRTALGQTVEIDWMKKNKLDLNDEDCFFVIDGKTVYYSIAGPMRLGAMIAGASPKQLRAIGEFALPLGRCFQIKDDLLDLTSNFRGLKKQAGSDLLEGKRTIMLMHLWRTAAAEDKTRLLKIMAKPRAQKTDKDIVLVLALMKKYGSLSYGQKLAEDLAKQALILFEKKLGFLSCQPARDQLKATIDFVLKRDH